MNLNGTITFGDWIIDWKAEYDADDGFSWIMTGARVNGDYGYELHEWAADMVSHGPQIDAAVRAAFNAQCAAMRDDNRLAAAGF